MEVKRLTKDDTRIVTSILTHLIDSTDRKTLKPPADHLEVLLTDERTYLFAALLDDSVVGFALAYRFPSLYATEHLAYLYDIEVLPVHRRKGIGRHLVEAVCAVLRNDGVKELWLGTDVDNVEGQGLFSATGAIKSDETFNDYTYYLS